MKEIQPNEIWLVIDSLRYGGIETHVLELAKGLKEQHIPVRVVLLKRYSEFQNVLEKLQSGGVPFDMLTDLYPDLTALSALKKAAKAYKPYVLHAHGYKASIVSKVTRFLLPFQSIKQISTYHSGEVPKGRVKLYDILDRYTAFMSNVSLAVSKKIQDKLPFQSVHINNFISFENPPPNNGKQIAFVGRLSQEKAPDRFVELAKSFPNETFHIYGTGPMEQQLKWISKNSSINNLFFCGHQKEMDKVWDNVGTLIICSRFEGLPMTALEAMARGIIVVTLNIGDLNLLIQNRVNGFITESNEHLEELLRECLAFPLDKKVTLRENAQRTIKVSYSRQSTIHKILSLYEILTPESDTSNT